MTWCRGWNSEDVGKMWENYSEGQWLEDFWSWRRHGGQSPQNTVPAQLAHVPFRPSSSTDFGLQMPVTPIAQPPGSPPLASWLSAWLCLPPGTEQMQQNPPQPLGINLTACPDHICKWQERALFFRPQLAPELEASLVMHPVCWVGDWPIGSVDAAPFFLCPLFILCQGQLLFHNFLTQSSIDFLLKGGFCITSKVCPKQLFWPGPASPGRANFY